MQLVQPRSQMLWTLLATSSIVDHLTALETVVSGLEPLVSCTVTL